MKRSLSLPIRLAAAGLLILSSGLRALCAQAAAQQQETTTNKAGEALYKQRCAGCHEGGVPRAPNRAALQQMSPENIRFALKSGSMVIQGLGLSSSQISDLAEFLTGKQPAK